MSTMSIPRRAVRRLIRARNDETPLGFFARWYAEARGWRLACGLRMVISDPREFIQSRILNDGIYEPEVSRVMTALLGPDDLFLDVGGNIGNHTLVAASCGARVHAFEPVPRLAAALRKNVLLNKLDGRVTVIESAIGDRKGTAMLNVAQRSDDGSHSFIAGVEAESVQQISVPVISLDEYIAAFDEWPTLVKVDVEGYEARVLDGATSLLEQRKCAFVIETADRLANEIGESARSVLGRFFDREFALFRIPPTGPLEKQSRSETTGELMNYLCVHPCATRSYEAAMALAA